MSELQLQVGEWYERRNGEIAGPVAATTNVTYEFEVDRDTFTRHGNYVNEGIRHPRDLVAHVPRTDPRHPKYQPAQPDESEHVEVTISVPKPPDGWRVDVFRGVRRGEYWLRSDGRWCLRNHSDGFEHLVAVPITPLWTPPAWLAPGWVAVDVDGKIYWYSKKPAWINESYWYGGATTVMEIPLIAVRDFTPPPISGEHAIWEIK